MNITNRKKELGFTLLELLIALLIASLSVLGFAYTQTKSLQYARSSSQYTIASVQASNTIEQIWASLCEIQSGSKTLDSLSLADGFERTFTPATFSNEMTIHITNNNDRLTDVDDSVEVKAVFPAICS